MAVDLNVTGLWPFAVGLVGFALAVVVYRARPDRWQNRFVAATLALEPFLFSFGVGWTHMLTDPGSVYGLVFASMVAGPAFQVVYLGFLSTLDTPLTRPLRHSATRLVLGIYVVAFWAVLVAYPSAVVRAVVPGDGTPWTPIFGPMVTFLRVSFLVLFVYGLVAAVSAWRRTEPGSLERRRNGWFVAAFGVRDVGVFALLALTVFVLPNVPVPEPIVFGLDLAFPVPALLMFVMLSYGVLKTQLFDVDLKIKWSLEKGTVAAIFVAVFFVASEGAQVVFADFAGNEILGVLAAGALVFLLSPLQRLAEQVGDAAMPDVEDTEAYREQRKRDVYRASLEELLADGEISAKERRMLGRLQDELGLDGGEASRIEADLVEGGGGAV